MKKSKEIVLTLLTTAAISSCSKENPTASRTPYDDYQYYGRARDTGMVYSHFAGGILYYYMWSRMFNGMNYYSPNYYGRGYYGGARGFNAGRHAFAGAVPSTKGFAGAHTAISRGGFGASGYGFNSARS